MKDHEIEVKFYIADLPSLEVRLRSIGAQLIRERILEQNLRFDKPGGELKRTYQVLRLRQDDEIYITYKGPAEDIEGVRKRKEIEIRVDDFQAARQLLIELGFQISMIYEKYRTIYGFLGTQIALDELPYGNYIEIEGPEPATIRDISRMLDLNWDTRIPDSYTASFDQLQIRLNLDFRDLLFENFKELNISSQDLQVIPADS